MFFFESFFYIALISSVLDSVVMGLDFGSPNLWCFTVGCPREADVCII